jgi:hypothetical protein
MKSSNHKTAESTRKKRFTMCFVIAIVFCLFNLFPIKAPDPVKQTSTTDTKPTIATEKVAEPGSTVNLQQMPIQIRVLVMASNIMKARHDTMKSTIRNRRYWTVNSFWVQYMSLYQMIISSLR